jgi:uncharacterized protein YjbI with pentapeptide repeats
LRVGLLALLAVLISAQTIQSTQAAAAGVSTRPTPGVLAAGVTPLVPVSAALTRTRTFRQISGSVRWNASGLTGRSMSVGTLRVTAVQSGSNLPTLLVQQTYRLQPSTTLTRFNFRWPSPKFDQVMATGNRIVVTASQHAPTSDLPTPSPVYTTDSYVTVLQVQAGAPRPAGIGTRNCSDRSVAPPPDGTTEMNFDFCDLTGASLPHAALAPTGPPSSFRKANLTGADLTGAYLSHALLSGSLLAGADASGADMTFTSIAGSLAPRFAARATLISNLSGIALYAPGADFSHSTLAGGTLQGSNLRGANFTATTLTSGVVLWSADLRGAYFAGSYLDAPRMLLTNLTAADLRGATYVPAVSVGADFRWTTLCRTTWFNGSQNNRDCPWPRSRR